MTTITHTFRTTLSDVESIKQGTRFTVSMTNNQTDALIPNESDVGLVLVRLEAEPKIRRAFELIGIIINVVYHSGYRHVIPRGYNKKPLPCWHPIIEEGKQIGEQDVFLDQDISGPIFPFFIPRSHNMALHLRKISPDIVSHWDKPKELGGMLIEPEPELFEAVAHFEPVARMADLLE